MSPLGQVIGGAALLWMVGFLCSVGFGVGTRNERISRIGAIAAAVLLTILVVALIWVGVWLIMDAAGRL